MQAGLNVGFDDAAELQQDCLLGLRHDVQAAPDEQGHHYAADQGEQRSIGHQRLSLERRLRC
ncbi:hypothetical protein D3C84_1195680 [compost metagenome]